jgi:hyperosmotically inducible protein
MSSRWLFGICGSLMFVAACSQSDAGITTSVKSQLISDDAIKANDINVDTQNHVVTLTGEVRTPTEEARAVELARSTKGVTDVVNHLTIVAAAPTSGHEADQSATERAKEKTGEAYENTKQGAENLGERTKQGAENLGEKTKEGARKVGETTKDAVSKTGEVITDGWITSRVHERFVGEDLLKGSDINVDTNDHVVTLKGTVMSAAGRGKAVEIAKGTEGVHQVIDRLMVAPKK